MIMMFSVMVMRHERNGWMELLPSKNNQKQPIGLDRLQFTAMRIVMDHNDDDGDDDNYRMIKMMTVMMNMVMDKQSKVSN